MSNQSGQLSAWCQPCSVALGPDNPAEDHNRSRLHINRLLQLGLELPFDNGDLDQDLGLDSNGQEVALPEMPMCIVCETSLGETPAQAAQHYRSREHMNKRLQKGLPVASQPQAGSDNDQRDYINHCLRRGNVVPQNGAVSLTPAVAPAVATVAQIQPKSMNGKRKLPGPAGIAVGPRSPSGTIAASASGFAQEKRACRPGAALQKGASDFQLNNHMGLAAGLQMPTSSQFGMSLSAGNSPVPGGGVYRPAVLRTHTAGARPTRHMTPSGHWNVNSGAACFEPVQTTLGPRAALFSDQHHERHNAAVFADHCAAKYQEQPSVMYADQRNTPATLYDQHNVIFSSPHSAVYSEHGTVYNDGWFCDLCNIALPTAIALSQHTNSAEHRLAAEWTRARGHGPTLFQPS